jgi:PAT family beta-lactamase induction signal transducer AmpG
MADESGAVPAPRRTFLQSLLVFADRRIAIMLALGFSAGLPNLLVFQTLSAWLRSAGLSLGVISLFSLGTLAYALKFLWAPLVDRTTIPVLTKLLGHRRSWMIVAQVCVGLGLLAVSLSNPKAGLLFMAVFTTFTAFSGATQDIVIDAWRIEAAEMSRQGAMATAYQWGYRIAMLISGAVPLALSDHYTWNFSYGVVACLIVVGMLGVLLAPREHAHVIRPIETGGLKESPALETLEWLLRLAVMVIGAAIAGSGLAAKADILSGGLSLAGLSDAAGWLKHAWTAKPNGVWLQLLGVAVGLAIIVVAAWPIPRVKTRPGIYLSAALGEPLRDFFRRFGKSAGLILALICFYRISDFVLNLMTNFYQDLGFTGTEIAEAQKVFGFWATMGGVLLGGLSVARLGTMRSMIIGAFALPITNTFFGWLATQGPSLPDFFSVIAIENVASGFAGTCLIAYMSTLTTEGFTATQYALFSSLYALPGKLIASQSGRIVESAARASDKGGLLQSMQALFAETPAKAFATAMAKSHVSPHALGVGYVVFFLYAGGVGVLSMVLVLLVARRGRPQPSVSSAPSS